MKLSPWLRLFRLPNLPTALCDAVGGGVFAVFLLANSIPQDTSVVCIPRMINLAFAAGLCELFFYIFGLIDNDVADVKRDRQTRNDRPIANGEISLSAAKLVREGCLVIAVLIATLFKMPPLWWGFALAIVACVLLYNRIKHAHRILGFVFMALCRSIALLSGAAAVCILPDMSFSALLPILWLSLAEFVYIASVSFIAKHEDLAPDSAPAKLGFSRFLGAFAMLLPLPSFYALYSQLSVSNSAKNILEVLFIPAIFLLYTAARWVVAVLPLDKLTDTAKRRAITGETISLLLFFQTGFVLMGAKLGSSLLIILAGTCFIASYAIRQYASSISGS